MQANSQNVSGNLSATYDSNNQGEKLTKEERAALQNLLKKEESTLQLGEGSSADDILNLKSFGRK